MNDSINCMKKIQNADYEDKVVAFIDIMGVKELIKQSKKPSDLLMYSSIICNFQNFTMNGKLKIVSFSDCMYIISDKENIIELLSFISLLSHFLMFDDSTKYEDYSGTKTINCHKIRGGITFGKIYSVGNMVIGSAALRAYELESKIAVYPRILLDINTFDKDILLQDHFSESCVKDNDGNFYFDYIQFNKLSGNEQIIKDFQLIHEVIEFVEEEKEKTFKTNNAKLIGQLEWFLRYLNKKKVDFDNEK